MTQRQIHICVFNKDPPHMAGLMQERQNSIANALELRLSCTSPSIWDWVPCHKPLFVYNEHILYNSLISWSSYCWRKYVHTTTSVLWRHKQNFVTIISWNSDHDKQYSQRTFVNCGWKIIVRWMPRPPKPAPYIDSCIVSLHTAQP